MEEHTGLLYEGTQASEDAWTRWAQAEEVHVLWSFVIPDADSGEQEVNIRNEWIYVKFLKHTIARSLNPNPNPFQGFRDHQSL